MAFFSTPRPTTTPVLADEVEEFGERLAVPRAVMQRHGDEFAISIMRHLVLNQLMVPHRLAQQVLQTLLVNVVLDFGHVLHVASGCADQPTQEVDRGAKGGASRLVKNDR